MRYLILLFCFITGCASARMTRMQCEPEKGGVVKLNWTVVHEYSAREEARELMSEFCWPNDFKILGSAESSKTEEIISINTKSEKKRPYVFFRCVAKGKPETVGFKDFEG